MLLKHQAAVAISVCIVLWVLATFPFNLYFQEMKGGWAELYQQRLLPLHSVLPPNVVIGYISDANGENRKAALFQFTQYFLAPVMIDNSTDRELLIGDFFAEGSCKKFCETHAFEVIHAFSDRLCVLRKLK